MDTLARFAIACCLAAALGACATSQDPPGSGPAVDDIGLHASFVAYF